MSAKNPAGEMKKLSGIRKFLYSDKIAPYVFTLPFIIAFLLFFLSPIIQSVNMSFHRVHNLADMEFVGLRNYARLDNSMFWSAVRTNTTYMLLCVATMIPIPMLLAVLLNTKVIKGRNFYRAVVFIPSLTSVIVAGIAFRLIYGTLPTALANSILGLFGVGPVNWIMEWWPGMFIMLSLALWRMCGVYMIYFLAALQAIPEELYESADIDGANTVMKFRYITLPLIKPTAVYVLTLVVFEGYRMFNESFVYWNLENPGNIGLTITRYIYREAFRNNDMGFASAIGITLLGIVLVINLIQLNAFGLFRKEDK